jgi:hypothetical protein
MARGVGADALLGAVERRTLLVVDFERGCVIGFLVAKEFAKVGQPGRAPD